MNVKTKSELSDIKRNIDRIFNKITTNPNLTPVIAGIAMSSVIGIALSITSGATIQYADAHAIFWMRP